jgi:hypothetical protein
MTIVVKYSDTKTQETDFKIVNDESKLKYDYFQKMLDSKHTYMELIYPHHSETFTLYSINYRRCR